MLSQSKIFLFINDSKIIKIYRFRMFAAQCKRSLLHCQSIKEHPISIDNIAFQNYQSGKE